MYLELFWSLKISMFAITWCWLLTDFDDILEKPYAFLQKKLEDKHNWLWYPIWGCPKCVSGQIALWLFLYQNFSSYQDAVHTFYFIAKGNAYQFISLDRLFFSTLFHHVIAVSTTVFLTFVLMQFYYKLQNKTKEK